MSTSSTRTIALALKKKEPIRSRTRKMIESKSGSGDAASSIDGSLVKPAHGINYVKSATSFVNRQKTYSILRYRLRKSYSAMDFKESTRRNIHLKIKNVQDIAISTPSIDDEALKAQLAGMKIFSAVLLSRWRKSRENLKIHEEANKNLLQASAKSKQQSHLVNQLLTKESERCEYLAEDVCNLKVKLREADDEQLALNGEIEALKYENAKLLSEIEAQNSNITTLKEDCFKLQSEWEISNHILEVKLSQLDKAEDEIEFLRVTSQESSKDLNLTITEKTKVIDKLEGALEEKEIELAKTKEELQKKKEELMIVKKVSYKKILEATAYESELKAKLDALENEANILRQYVAQTVGQRIKKGWENAMSYRGNILSALHWVLFVTNPNFPRPSVDPITFGRAIENIKNLGKKR